MKNKKEFVNLGTIMFILLVIAFVLMFIIAHQMNEKLKETESALDTCLEALNISTPDFEDYELPEIIAPPKEHDITINQELDVGGELG